MTITQTTASRLLALTTHSALLLTVVSCAADPNSTGDKYEGTTPRMQDELDAIYQEDLAFYMERREEYELSGTVPTVPPSLSEDPYDPTFEFLGYADFEPPSEEPRWGPVLDGDEIPEMEPEEAASLEDPDESFTPVYVNDAGEMWAENVPEGEMAARLEEYAQELSEPEVGSRPSEDHVAEEEAELADSWGVRSIIGGVDNRKLRSVVNDFDMRSYPWRAQGSLLSNGTTEGTFPNPTCSATKIGPRTLMTSAHCVFDKGGGKKSLNRVDWVPGADGPAWISGNDDKPNGWRNVQWYVVPKRFISGNGWNTRDFAALVLYDHPVNCDLGWFGTKKAGTLLGDRPWNFGYPRAVAQCGASPFGNGLCFGGMYGMRDHIHRTTSAYVFTNHDAQRGHSGSSFYGFYGGGDRRAIGVLSFSNDSETFGPRMRKMVFEFYLHAIKKNKFRSDYCQVD